MSHTSDRWDRGYPFGKQNKATWHRWLRLWLWLPSNQFLHHARAKWCLLLLVWTAAPPLPPNHMLSYCSKFLRRCHTMSWLAAYLCITVVSTRQPRTWWGASCWRNYTGIFSTAVCCVPLPGICAEGLCMHLGFRRCDGRLTEYVKYNINPTIQSTHILTTLTFQIVVHIRLFIFRKIAVLYGLIRVYTFIRFVSNPPYTIYIWSMFITLKIFNIFEVILM